MTSAPSEPRVLVVEGTVSDRVVSAASWLADQPSNPIPVIPALLDQFDLPHDDAQEVIALAGRTRMLPEAFA